MISLVSFRQGYPSAPFGLYDLTWVIVEALKPKLTPGVVGDVDILAGNLIGTSGSLSNGFRGDRSGNQSADVLKKQQAGMAVSRSDESNLYLELRLVSVIDDQMRLLLQTGSGPPSHPMSEESGSRSIGLENGLDKVGLLDVIGNRRLSERGIDSWTLHVGQFFAPVTHAGIFRKFSHRVF